MHWFRGRKQPDSRSPSPFPSHPRVPAPAPSPAGAEPSPHATSDVGGEDERCPRGAARFGVPPCSTVYPLLDALRAPALGEVFPGLCPCPAASPCPGHHTCPAVPPQHPHQPPQKDFSAGFDICSVAQLCRTPAPARQRGHQEQGSGAFCRAKQSAGSIYSLLTIARSSGERAFKRSGAPPGLSTELPVPSLPAPGCAGSRSPSASPRRLR